MVKLNEERDGMDKRRSAICSILEANTLAIDAALKTRNKQTIPDHLSTIKRFVGEAEKYGLGKELTQKYKLILKDWGAD